MKFFDTMVFHFSSKMQVVVMETHPQWITDYVTIDTINLSHIWNHQIT